MPISELHPDLRNYRWGLGCMHFKWWYLPETPGAPQAASKSGAEGSAPARDEPAVGAVRGLRGWVGKGPRVHIQRSLGKAMVQIEGIPPKNQS